MALRPSDNFDSLINDDDRPRLIVGEEETHWPLRIVPILCSKLVTFVLLIAAAYSMPIFYKEEARELSAFSILQFLHVCMWAKFLIITRYVKKQHIQSRLLGYHKFYNSSKNLYSITLYVFTCGNVMLVILGCLVHDFCLGNSTSACSVSVPLSPVGYQQILICIEVLICVPFVCKYINEVAKFNARKSPPDILCEELSFRSDSYNVDQFIGFQGPSSTELVLERQAELMDALVNRNNILCQQVYILAAQIQARQNV